MQITFSHHQLHVQSASAFRPIRQGWLSRALELLSNWSILWSDPRSQDGKLNLTFGVDGNGGASCGNHNIYAEQTLYTFKLCLYCRCWKVQGFICSLSHNFLTEFWSLLYVLNRITNQEMNHRKIYLCSPYTLRSYLLFIASGQKVDTRI